ncbi:uncharacterized protein [Diadema setosum]|uniref:uncharacterized protein isoform X1 n=1 Tax=Diadema setosum TaxID=31175 RepID=UPI003B3AFE3E
MGSWQCWGMIMAGPAGRTVATLKRLPWLDPLKDFFTCPVCMCLYHMTVMTPCGHRYCEGCILEWIDRRHRCPCCNAVVKISSLVRDTGFDGLVSVITKERDRAEEAYFTSLIEKCNPSSDGEGTSAGAPASFVQSEDMDDDIPKKSETQLSPVEEILQKHIRIGIVEHERYYRKLKRQFERQLENAQMEIRQLESATDEAAIAEKNSWLVKRQELKEEFERCIKLLAKTYDKYLTDHLPTLGTLPVTIFFRLYGKSLTVGDMVIQPHASLSSIKQDLFMKVREKQDRVAVYKDENVHYLLIRPYARGHIMVDEALVATLLSRPNPYSSDPSDLVCLLSKDSIPVLEYSIQPGSHIVIFGEVKLRSELPKPCFAFLFEEGEEKTDYFSCKECKFNWICRSCKEHCHKDHETVPYVMGHQPTWACCYCPRKKKCLLQDQCH